MADEDYYSIMLQEDPYEAQKLQMQKQLAALGQEYNAAKQSADESVQRYINVSKQSNISGPEAIVSALPAIAGLFLRGKESGRGLGAATLAGVQTAEQSGPNTPEGREGLKTDLALKKDTLDEAQARRKQALDQLSTLQEMTGKRQDAIGLARAGSAASDARAERQGNTSLRNSLAGIYARNSLDVAKDEKFRQDMADIMAARKAGVPISPDTMRTGEAMKFSLAQDAAAEKRQTPEEKAQEQVLQRGVEQYYALPSTLVPLNAGRVDKQIEQGNLSSAQALAEIGRYDLGLASANQKRLLASGPALIEQLNNAHKVLANPNKSAMEKEQVALSLVAKLKDPIMNAGAAFTSSEQQMMGALLGTFASSPDEIMSFGAIPELMKKTALDTATRREVDPNKRLAILRESRKTVLNLLSEVSTQTGVTADPLQAAGLTSYTDSKNPTRAILSADTVVAPIFGEDGKVDRLVLGDKSAQARIAEITNAVEDAGVDFQKLGWDRKVSVPTTLRDGRKVTMILPISEFYRLTRKGAGQ